LIKLDSMRIVIDLQGAQCGSRDRGIGRYSLSLAQAMVRNRGNNDVLIVLNGMFPETIEPIISAFDGLCSKENILVWNAQAPVNSNDPRNTWRRHTAEFTREVFLASLKPDIVHISSLMEGFNDDAVNSIGILNATLPTAVTFYDLIPLIQSEIYLTPYPEFELAYREKLGHLDRANLYLAISESSREEAIKYVSVSNKDVINISAGVDECFKPTLLTAEKKQEILKKFGFNRRFLMCSGATDERKNHIRLIKAFALLPLALRNAHQLAIVGGLSSAHEKQFRNEARLCGLRDDEVVITRRVSDDELIALYNLSILCVFPSWHEGFGLPALEAMSCGCAVICSNNTSLPEIVGREDALFDPFEEKSIATKMEQVLTSEEMRADLARHSLSHSKLFTWNRSGQIAISALEKWHEEQLALAALGANDRDVNSASWLIKSIARVRESATSDTPQQDHISSVRNIDSKNIPNGSTENLKKTFSVAFFVFLLVLLSMPLVFSGLVLIVFSGFTKNKSRSRSGARAFNHFINASIFNGNAWETVASHAWRMRDKRWAKIFIVLANYIQSDHCFRANKRGQPVVDFITRRGLD
jgi:glycosyltransferase involved in cell wall biosynthesis